MPEEFAIRVSRKGVLALDLGSCLVEGCEETDVVEVCTSGFMFRFCPAHWRKLCEKLEAAVPLDE